MRHLERFWFKSVQIKDALIVKPVGDDSNRPAESQADCVRQRVDCHPPLQESVLKFVLHFKRQQVRKQDRGRKQA